MATFTADWFSHNIPNFTLITNYYKRSSWSIDSILEIGSFEGRSTCWMLENMLSDIGTISCVDPYTNYDVDRFSFAPTTIDYSKPWASEIAAAQGLFRANTDEFKKPGQAVELRTERSFKALAQDIVDQKQYDFIYVDGNHVADIVLADACMAFPLLKKGGIMLFDDYLWDHVDDHLDRCKMTIDAFVNMYVKSTKILFVNYQLAILKL